MMYISTRGGMAPQPFSDILLEGLAPDGGLTVPESLPAIDAETLEGWRALPYDQLAARILALFIDDIAVDDLRRLTAAAYTPDVFGGADIVPLKPLRGGLALVGLSQGPTLAFKDMAMQFLGHVFEYVLARRSETLNILGATSGDTGSAAEYALRGKQGIAVFMLSPHGRMSDFQRAQMYSLQDPNIHNLAVKGVFDDCQDIVKALAGDLQFKSKYRIGAVNSINWARIAAQIVYYFWGWLRATDGLQGTGGGSKAPASGVAGTGPATLGQAASGPAVPGGTPPAVSFAVPSGNFGNILAGHFARRMGLPIRRLVLATNENNVLEEFFRTGVYQPRSAAQTHATSSPSMDISRASNFERFVFDLVDRDAARVRALWGQLADTGSFDLSDLRPGFEARYGFASGVSTHADRLRTIRAVYEESGVLVDPHTADGIKVAREHVEPGVPMLVLETALPAKFGEIIKQATGLSVPVPDHLGDLLSAPQRVHIVNCDTQVVRDYIVQRAKG